EEQSEKDDDVASGSSDQEDDYASKPKEAVAISSTSPECSVSGHDNVDRPEGEEYQDAHVAHALNEKAETMKTSPASVVDKDFDVDGAKAKAAVPVSEQRGDIPEDVEQPIATPEKVPGLSAVVCTAGQPVGVLEQMKQGLEECNNSKVAKEEVEGDGNQELKAQRQPAGENITTPSASTTKINANPEQPETLFETKHHIKPAELLEQSSSAGVPVVKEKAAKTSLGLNRTAAAGSAKARMMERLKASKVVQAQIGGGGSSTAG
ncbi:unnamed protein product, partial [Amoebophrya sp. A120]